MNAGFILSMAEPPASTSAPATKTSSNGIHAVGRASFVSPVKRAENLWAQWETSGVLQEGRLPRSKVKEFLSDLELSDADVSAAMQPMEGAGSGGSDDALTFEQASSLLSALEEVEPPSPSASSSAALTSSPSGTLAKAPFKKILVRVYVAMQT